MCQKKCTFSASRSGQSSLGSFQTWLSTNILGYFQFRFYLMAIYWVHIRFDFLMGIQTTYNDNFMIVKFWSLLKHIDTKVHVCKVQVSVPNLEFKYWRVSTRFVIHWAVADISGLLKRSSIYLHVFENYFSFSTCLQKVNIYLGNQGKVGTYKMVGSFFEAQLMGKINLL